MFGLGESSLHAAWYCCLLNCHPRKPADLIALANLSIPVDCLFVSEIDERVRELQKVVLDHCKVNCCSRPHDMLTRPYTAKGEMDLYMASPPCQSFSSAGLGQAGLPQRCAPKGFHNSTDRRRPMICAASSWCAPRNVWLRRCLK